MPKDTFNDIVHETCELIRNSAGSRKSLILSPETAERLSQVKRRTNTQLEAKRRKLLDLEQEVKTCKQCRLAETRHNVVFGSGNPNSKLVFVGEAPGYEEDMQGLPFVGRAGQLLTDIIEKGMKLSRSEVYICNVLKCRPPENRNPLPEEIECCEPFLIRQLEIIKPRVICALGTYAAQTLLKTKSPIGQLRGKWHFYHGIPLRATYHPAYLLRNPADKRKAWTDVLEVLKVYNGEEEPRPE